MPLLTPSRIAIVVLSLSFISFLWTFGLPHSLSQPSLPVVDHYPAEGKIHTAPIVPAPVIESTHTTTPPTSSRISRRISSHTSSHISTPTSSPTPLTTPTQPDDHRWDDASNKSTHVDDKIVPSAPKETGPAGHDDDGGRWDDKDKAKDVDKDKAKGADKNDDKDKNKGKVATTSPTPSTSHTPTPKPSAPPPVLKFCKEVHNAPHVMVIVRTSKAEINTKLAAHLKGLLSCVPNFAIFSDHAGEIDGIPVHDALGSIGDAARTRHDPFREYDAIKADPQHTPDPKQTKELDKWKFMPMVYKAYNLNPDAKFYVFIEADTSLSWANLLQWTNRLDYRIPYYSGAPSFLNKVQFAQRGPGIMLSQGAMRQYAKTYDERYTSIWEPRIGKECCGDMVLATALSEAHVEFYHSWPLLQGEQPNTLDFSKRHWCVPAISWHHVEGEALDQAWDSQKNWTHTHGWEVPYLYQHAFEEHVAPIISMEKKNWDNLSADTKIVAPEGRQKELAKSKLDVDKTPPPRRLSRDDKKEKDGKDKDKGKDSKDKEKEKDTDWGAIGATIKDGADNPTACQKLCTEVEDCLQWRYTTAGDGECHLSKVIRRGAAAEAKEDAPTWTSGWMVERITTTLKEWECDGKVKWGFYQ